MEEETLLQFLNLAEKLKCHTRHSWTSSGRQESVAEHVYRLLVFAWLVREEFPDYDMNRVMELALFHDMGEALTGDIPAFEKDKEDEKKEEQAQEKIAGMLPEPYRERLADIFREVEKKETKESRLLAALDKLEALIQHNEADLSTWLPLEYDLQLTYGQEQTKSIPYMKKLRKRVYEDSVKKMEEA
ncbi:HD domain-containing protein [Claveliimonas bilis]|uniref:HD domain-containing protein n=1 Tax=Clostridia TaxID=186801 RepID=UPI001C3A8549|nr:HD domain-containing protein [Claveliimonas bilis]MCQ5202252.1 HD domain-containing protein [Mordavella massiliensis]BCZ26096.1 phosphohydrolase [Claveliimonas bilis]HIZ60252.1 HD domain-containing protein [Candidatus Dorea faecipullorum]